MQPVTRRKMLTGLAAMAAFSALPRPAAALFRAPARCLDLLNLHTGEALKVTYWEGGRYIPGALSEINRVLRDHRNDQVKAIDPALLDQLIALRTRLGVEEPFQVVSAYRSPESNALLRRESGGVAKHSLHLEGRAVDIRLKTRSAREIQAAALQLASGGVGYYPSSNFVHLDTGRVRRW